MSNFQAWQHPYMQTGSWKARSLVLFAVMTFHALAFFIWTHQEGIKAASVHAISISVEMAQPEAQQALHKNIVPVPAVHEITEKPQQRDLAEPAAAMKSTVQQLPAAATQVEPVKAAPSTAMPVQATPAVVPATEPDYKAGYLNNTPPAYPLAARRMGMQGKVLLHVEVLASGISGQVEVTQSSGYAMLDNAAKNAVRSWRFVPAMQAGHAVDKWFIIPIQFSLKEA